MPDTGAVSTGPAGSPTSASASSARFVAVLLTGGTAARMDRVDKAAVELDGRPLLAHALDALAEAAEVVVVGPMAPTTRPVTFTREDPPLGGPVAGLVAGRAAVTITAPLLALLAVDMPRVTSATFRRLREAMGPANHGAILVDASGRRQLCALLDLARLDVVLAQVLGPAGTGHGQAVHRLLARLDLAEVDADGPEAADVDTWRDLRELS